MDFFKALWNDLSGIVGDTVTLGTNSVTTLNIIVWSLFIGFMIGIGVTLYNKLVLGSLVRGLIEREAFTEGSAVSAAEIGCNNPFIRFAMRKNSSLRRVVYIKGDTEERQNYAHLPEACLYIPEDKLHRAEMIYGNSGMSVSSVLLAVAAFLIVAIVSFIVIPDLITMLSNFIEGITPESNIL